MDQRRLSCNAGPARGVSHLSALGSGQRHGFARLLQVPARRPVLDDPDAAGSGGARAALPHRCRFRRGDDAPVFPHALDSCPEAVFLRFRPVGRLFSVFQLLRPVPAAGDHHSGLSKTAARLMPGRHPAPIVRDFRNRQPHGLCPDRPCLPLAVPDAQAATRAAAAFARRRDLWSHPLCGYHG